jgi:hypothetical protein
MLWWVLACSGGESRPSESDSSDSGSTDVADQGPADSADDDRVTDAEADRPSEAVTIIFGANFAAPEQTCRKSNTAGCDLYRARFDPETQAVSEVIRLTDTSEQTETFPAIDPSGRWVLYERRSGDRRAIWALDLDGEVSPAEVASDGRYPDFDHQGERFAYSVQIAREAYRIHVARYAAHDSGFEVIDDEEATPGRDPQFAPDGESLIHHYKPDGAETRTAVYDFSAQTVTDFSEPNDGCAHAAFSADGAMGYCGQTGRIWSRREQPDSGWSPLETFAEPRDPSDYGAPLSQASFVSYGFPETCGSDDYLLVEGGGQSPGIDTRNAIVLLDIENDAIIDLHGALEDAYGVSGADTYTATCTVVEGERR